LGQNTRVKGKASISSEEGGDDQGGGSTYSHVFYVFSSFRWAYAKLWKP